MKTLEFGACEYASGEKQWPIARDYCGHTCSSDFGSIVGVYIVVFHLYHALSFEERTETEDRDRFANRGHLIYCIDSKNHLTQAAPEERFPTHGPRCTTDPPRGRAIHSVGHSGHKTCRHPSVNPFVLLLLFTPHHRRPIVRRSPVGHPRSGQRANSNQFDGRSVGHHRHDHPTTFGTFIAPTQRHV